MREYTGAIIGTGGIAAAHVRAWQAMGGRERIVAAMDVDAARVAAFCGEHGIQEVYTDVAPMLAAVKPDLVHVCSPPNLHAVQVIQCLEAGAWVLCEKPFCAGLAEWDAIAAAEERTGRYCEVGFQWRWGSAARHFKRLLDGGTFGRPLTGVCDMLWYRDAAYFAAAPWRGAWATAFGGPTTNTGIHGMDLYLWTMGDWAEVTALAVTLDHPMAVDDVTLALVRFESGAIASFANSWVSPRMDSRLRWDTQRGTVELITQGSYTNEKWHVTPGKNPGDEAITEAWGTLAEDEGSTQIPMLRSLLDAMDANVRPSVSGAESRRTVEFLSGVYKSAATKTTVRRGSIQPGDPFYDRMWGTLAHTQGGTSQDGGALRSPH